MPVALLPLTFCQALLPVGLGHPNTRLRHPSPVPVLPCRLCHIAVGTPGRLSALIQADALKCDSLAMLVLDEADALMGPSFYEDVTWIYDQLPRRKQVPCWEQSARV